MITCTAQADLAILLILVQADEFDAGISKQGQAKEQIPLAFTLYAK